MSKTGMRRPETFLAWLLVCFCFAGIPALILYFSLEKYSRMNADLQQESIKIELQLALSECSIITDIEKYWCRRLTNQFNLFQQQNEKLEDVELWLHKTREEYANCFNFLIWNTKGHILTHSLEQKPASEDWYEVFLDLARVCAQHPDINWSTERKADIKKVRDMLGPQYVGEMIEANSHSKIYGFAWPDSALKKPLLWTYFYDRGGALLLFDQKRLFGTELPRTLAKLKSRGRNHQWGLYSVYDKDNKIWSDKSLAGFAELQEKLQFCEENMLNFVETADYYLATAFLTPQLRIFVVDRKQFSLAQKRLIPKLAAFILLILMIPFYRYTFKTLVMGCPGTINIRPRLAVMFFFANAIPFLAMSIVAQEYYQQKRDALLKDIHKRSVELLKDYDKRLDSTCSKLEHEIQTFFDGWAEKLEEGKLTEEKNNLVLQAAKDNIVDNFFLISSSSSHVGSFAGIRKVEENLKVKDEKEQKKQFSVAKNNNSSAQVFNLIGKRIMNELNGISKNNQAATKLELLAESILQKSFSEITHSFIKAMGGISSWGFGKIQNLTLLKFMSMPGSDMVDFMAVVLWNSKTVQRHYLATTLTSINRNPIGLKVLMRLEFSREYFPAGTYTDDELVNFIDRSTDRPSEEIEIINHAGQSCLAICFSGKHLERYKIVGLLPLEQIDRAIGRQKNDLKMLGVLSILLGLMLAQMLTRSFVQPLQQLSDAAAAIEKRQYQFRTNNISKNEFGEIATIFNDVMVGLEELEVAKVVQESLFPETSLTNEKVKIYGRSITMAELGGDYYDFFAIDEAFCGVLMGDVAGHGVGAALIMAMAKSGILSSSESLKEPKQLLEKLHQLIYSSKTAKQKKIMTFQYLSLNSLTGAAKYANAGACSPILVTGMGSEARELSLAGAALGAFKKAKFSEIELHFKPGDCMVFYTDGIIEARNPQGKEMGYEGFLRLVKNSWHLEPQIMYDTIYSAYLDHIGGQDAEDDLTMVIVVFA